VRVGAAADDVAVFKVSSLSGPQGVEGDLDTPPDVRAEKVGGFILGEEPKRSQLVVHQPETGDAALVKDAAIEDEHQRVGTAGAMGTQVARAIATTLEPRG
jgi:hypothetical protein